MFASKTVSVILLKIKVENQMVKRMERSFEQGFSCKENNLPAQHQWFPGD